MKKFYSLLLLTLFGLLSSYAQTIDESFVKPVPYKAAKINVIKELSDGKILLGGKIDFYKDKKVNNLIRLNADYSLDETFIFKGDPKLEIRDAKFQSNGNIIVVMDNPTALAPDHYAVHQLDLNGEIIASVTDLIMAKTIAIQSDDKILVTGGEIGAYGSSGCYLHRYNSDFSLDETFNNDLVFNASTNKVVVSNDGIYVGGTFTAVNGVSKNSLVKLNSDGILDTTFDVGEGAKGHAFSFIVQDDGKIVISGDFTRTVNIVPTYNVCRLNSDGTLDKTFLSQYYGYSNDFVIKDSFIYIETFLNDGNQFGYHIIKLNSNGTLNKSFKPIKLNEFWYNNFSLGIVHDQLFFNNCEYIGNRYGLSIADFDGNAIDSSELQASQYGNFQSGGYFDGKLVVKGDFVKVNDIETFGVGLLDINGGVDKSFVFPKYVGDIKEVQIIDDATIFISTKDKLLKLDNHGNVLKDFDYKTDSSLLGIEQFKVMNDGRILVTDQWGLYMLDASGKQQITYKVNPNSNSMYLGANINFGIQNDKIICKGQVEGLGNVVVRFNLDGTVDPDFKMGKTDSGIGRIKVLESGEIIVAGNFLKYNNSSTINQFAKLSKDGEVDLQFLENLEIPKIGISGGKYYDYKKIEEMDGVIYVTQGDANLTAVYLDGKPKNDFEMLTVIDNIADIIPLEHLEDKTSTTGRKAKSSLNANNYMIAIGTKNVPTGLSSVIVKLNLGAKTLSTSPTPEKENTTVRMYPVPVKEQLNVTFSNAVSPQKIAVYSIEGKELYSAKAENKSELQVDMSKFAAGVYFIKLSSDSGVVTKKIIKR